ncbi:MAG: hypothetical protein ACYDDF_14385 [Thermoplasmatota archaeon]
MADRALKVLFAAGGALIVIAAALLFLASRGTLDALAPVDRPSPPCPVGWVNETREDRCVMTSEVCNAWFHSSANETVACTARSSTGQGIVDVALSGTGTTHVLVQDAFGFTVLQQDFPSPASDELNVGGIRGDWRLTVTFENVGGDGTVVLWG